MGTTRLTILETRAYRADFKRLVTESEQWAIGKDNPYKGHFLCPIVYVKSGMQQWPKGQLEDALRASRAACDLRARHANLIALASGLAAAAAAAFGFVYASFDQSAKSAAVLACCVCIAVICLTQAKQRLGYDREREREKHWLGLGLSISDRLAQAARGL
jgi:hypothetical protein